VSGLKAGTYTGHVTVTGGGVTKAVTVVLTMTAVPVKHSVSLSWKGSTASNVVSYSMYRSTMSGSSYGLMASAIGGAVYSDQTVQSAATYYYVVTAVNNQGQESGYSNEIKVVIP
jgi:fibronectin type 3 domain-containing protein